MAAHRRLLSIAFVVVLIGTIAGQVTFESLCSPDVEVAGMSAVDGNDEFEIDLYEGRFLPEDTILCENVFLVNEVNALSMACCCYFSGHQAKTTELRH
jgi:hypothetical protein